MLSRNFRLQKVGDIDWLQKNYNFSSISHSIDELIILDVSRGDKNINDFSNALKKITHNCFIPISAGGGIKSVENARILLRSGADKVVVNSALNNGYGFIEELSSEFGAQCIVASVDVRSGIDGDYSIWTASGATQMKESAVEIIHRLSQQSIGELYLNSINQDGTGQGYDMGLLDLLPNRNLKPIILAGGAGNAQHLIKGLLDYRVDAVATAHLFNFVGDGLMRARNLIISNNINLPIWDMQNFEI